ncbi:MAG: phospho-N-acetylmuramoyl-pentapeptide-transferase, partial [Actinobacteria bacterium]|nr:phospho-N-acetylmuramoyl-pentapeptide-transferase [Actinomycetota bacterium]
MRIYPTFEVFAVAFLSLALTIILAPAWIAFLKSKSIGEEIRIDGPVKHLAKQGTPTMGGVLILFAALIPFLLRARMTTTSIVAVILTISCGLLGFIDDYLKVNRVRSLGLKARYKLLVQLIITIAIGLVVTRYANISTTVYIPVIKTGIN